MHERLVSKDNSRIEDWISVYGYHNSSVKKVSSVLIDQRVNEQYEPNAVTLINKAVSSFFYDNKKLAVLYHEQSGQASNGTWKWDQKLVEVKQYQFIEGKLRLLSVLNQ